MTARRFKKVAVLKGGTSGEREVSLRSGAAVAGGLREAGYHVEEVDVTGHELDLPRGVEAVFVALHGRFGEDGGVQRLLDAKGIPYTGSGAKASELAFDKCRSKKVMVEEDVPTAEYEVLHSGDCMTMLPPVVVKPAREGSTIGISRVLSSDEFTPALEKALVHDDKVLVERYVEGRELTVGIVGEEVLPVVEIQAPGGWYSYDAKYASGQTMYLVPAPITKDAEKRCKQAAWRTHTALGCRGLGRVDIRMSEDGSLYVLEINTIPGFTQTSLLPKAARAAGMTFPELCDRIMNLATLA